MLCLYDEVISGVKVHLSLIASLGLSTISMFVVFYFFLPQENWNLKKSSIDTVHPFRGIPLLVKLFTWCGCATSTATWLGIS